MKRTTSFLMVAVLLLSCIVTGCEAKAPQEADAQAQAAFASSSGVSPAPSPESIAQESTQPKSTHVAASSGESGQKPEMPPDTEWRFDDPGLHGVDAARLEVINNRMAGSQMLAAVIVRDGVVIHEFYQDGYDENSLFEMHSVTKSVMGALIGIAIERGVLDGVDVKLADLFPQMGGPENSGKERITVRHLLTHTSGLGEGDSNGSFNNHVRSQNWVDRFLSLPLNSEPGTAFFYSTAGSHMLSAVLEKAAGVSTYDFAVEHLFDPLGIKSFEWGQDPQGIADGGNGLSMNVRDAAKLGQLFLEGGNWRGTQLVPRHWVEESTIAQAAGEPYDKGQYGYQWWVWQFGGEDVYYALGYAGQFVFVVPGKDLVVSIASKSVWSDFTGQVCIREIIAACN